MYFFPSTWKQNLEFPRCKCPIERTHFLSSSRVFSSLFPSLSFFLRHSPRFSRRKKQTLLPRLEASSRVREAYELSRNIGVSAAFAYKYPPRLHLSRGHRDGNARSSGKSSDRSPREWIVLGEKVFSFENEQGIRRKWQGVKEWIII